jgi:hypothetical protein
MMTLSIEGAKSGEISLPWFLTQDEADLMHMDMAAIQIRSCTRWHVILIRKGGGFLNGHRGRKSEYRI